MALTDNIVSYWKFNESSGNASDSAGSNTLTNNNTTTYVAAKIANGANLVRSSAQSFNITNAAQTGLGLTGSMSFSFWMNPSGGMNRSTVPCVLCKDNVQNTYALYLGDGGAGGTAPNLNYLFRFFINGVEKNFATTLTTGSWYHVVVTFNASNGAFNLYINNTNSSSQTFAGSPITVNTSTQDFKVSSDGTAGRELDCVLDEFGVWSRDLTSTEVSTLYNSGNGLTYPFTSSSIPFLTTLNAG